MSLPPYNESLVLQTCQKTRALYREAGREPDEAYPVWPVRTQRDADAGMAYPVSEEKHLAECRCALGLPEPPPSPIVDPRVVRANFCNLTDSTGRPIYSACLAAQTPTMQAEWVQREIDAGGTHYLICVYSGYHDLYGERVHFWRANRWPEFLAALGRILDAGLTPVVMLDPGDACPGPQHFRDMIAAIPVALYPRCLWVPAFEPVAGAWTSRQFFDCTNAIRAALGPDPLMGCHLSPGRAQFSSNPPDPDDPWEGRDNWECWQDHWPGGVHPFAAFLYQSPVPAEGQYDHGPDGWCTRAQEVAARFLPGPVDRFSTGLRPTLIWMEATAYTFIRGQSSSAWAREVARYAQSLGYQGFGNGLP